MCFIFHAAMCALVLEDAAPAPHAFNSVRPPAGRQLVLARPVPGAPMPYPTDDYLNSVVRHRVQHGHSFHDCVRIVYLLL